MFHIDHIAPRSKGGATSLDNLALQCPNCSLHKAAKIEAVDPETGEMVALFHPLRQIWREHFRLEPHGACVGLTPVGRATAVALGMNAMIPRVARASQIALGLLSTFSS
jgi:HNH endonuclease